jgi:hypothetical protein
MLHVFANKVVTFWLISTSDFDGTIRFKVVRPTGDFVTTLGTLNQTKSNSNLGTIVFWDSLHAQL